MADFCVKKLGHHNNVVLLITLSAFYTKLELT